MGSRFAVETIAVLIMLGAVGSEATSALISIIIGYAPSVIVKSE